MRVGRERRVLLSASCLVVVVMVRGDVAAATRHYSFRNGYPATSTRSAGVSAAGEVRRVVAGLEDGERVSLVAADDSGKAKVTN